MDEMYEVSKVKIEFEEYSEPEYDDSLGLNPLCDKLSKFFAFDKHQVEHTATGSAEEQKLEKKPSKQQPAKKSKEKTLQYRGKIQKLVDLGIIENIDS